MAAWPQFPTTQQVYSSVTCYRSSLGGSGLIVCFGQFPQMLHRSGWRISLAASFVALLAVVAYGPRVVGRINPWERVSLQMLAAFGAEHLGYDPILLIGDSRAVGLGQPHFDQPRTIVFNMGVSGSTAAQWRTFLEHLRVPYPEAATAIIWLGVNDFIHDAAPAQVVAQHLRHVVATLHSKGDRVLILDQLPLDAKAAPLDGRVNIGSRDLNALFEAAPLTTATLIRVSDLFVPNSSANSTPQLSDGIHLTSRGNEQVWHRITTAVVATNN
jgi:lysophospholipase L1-like esterase